MNRPRFLPDNFTLALVTTVLIASVLPAHGVGAQIFETITTIGIGVLFFLHGAKLSREAVIAGIAHWRLHLLVLSCTFILFPVLGLALKPILAPLVTPELYVGVLFLCVLPSTVQSAIAFTSMARGNVPAAVCSASASTLLGVFITPLLVNLMVVHQSAGGASWNAIEKILLQLMAPFFLGHFLRPWIGKWISKRSQIVNMVDRGSILLVVYTAFSAAVIQGLWRDTPVEKLAGLIVVCAVLLACALLITAKLGKWIGFDRPDQIVVMFCGSKKSLASGIPMAKLLFASNTLGAVILPLMLFHQIQLMVCAFLAQRYAKQAAAADEILRQRVA